MHEISIVYVKEKKYGIFFLEKHGNNVLLNPAKHTEKIQDH